MPKRNITDEIISKRSRLGRKYDPAGLVQIRLVRLYSAIQELKKMPAKNRGIKLEMIRYISVGLVSCLEGYFRLSIRRLIDHGTPYRDNAIKLGDIRLDLATITRMHSTKMTAGELISHLLPLSSTENINRHLSTLLGSDYFDELKPMPIRGISTFQKAQPRAWDTLTSVFQDRHVACHELMAQVPWTFIRATDQWRVVFHIVEANEGLFKRRGVKELKRPSKNSMNAGRFFF